MIALPNATSQGSNGAGGGALTAFVAISAARAEPDTIASAVANKASFFMTIPITFLDSPVPVAPRASDNRLRPNPLPWLQSGTGDHGREAKKSIICCLFRRSEVFKKCCRRVLHSHNNPGLASAGRHHPESNIRTPFLRERGQINPPGKRSDLEPSGRRFMTKATAEVAADCARPSSGDDASGSLALIASVGRTGAPGRGGRLRTRCG